MGRDRTDPYRDLINHPVTQIDSFLLNFDIEDEWVGILGGPLVDPGSEEIAVEYNVRILDGPYDGQYSAEFTYWFEGTDLMEYVAFVDIYQRQVDAIETGFPDATVHCYEPGAWPD